MQQCEVERRRRRGCSSVKWGGGERVQQCEVERRRERVQHAKWGEGGERMQQCVKVGRVEWCGWVGRETGDIFIPQGTVAADHSNSMVPSKHSDREVESCNDTH